MREEFDYFIATLSNLNIILEGLVMSETQMYRKDVNNYKMCVY